MALITRGLRRYAVILVAIAVLLQAFPPGPAASADDSLPDTTLAVPWLGNLWSTLPNLTWAACDVSTNTRQVIDLALQQWTYAATNQGVPIKFSELPCTDGNTTAQVRVRETSSSRFGVPFAAPNLSTLGVTLPYNAQGQICGVDVTGPCVAQEADSYLFIDNWQKLGLSNAQEAKTVAHEFGHAVGLAVPHFCNFDSLMAQDCEPILPGLGPDDVQSIDALVAYARNYFGQTPLNNQPPPSPPGGTGTAVTYKAGYNLVAGPRGTNFSTTAGPLYTFLPGDSAYETFDSSQPAYNGYGYWAYFSRDTTVQLKGGSNEFLSVDATPGQWFLIGNDSGTSAMRVLGATDVETYDPGSGQYARVASLQPGQAAWVKPDRNGSIFLAATSLNNQRLNCYLNLGNPTSCAG